MESEKDNFCFSKWSAIFEKHSLDGEILKVPQDVLDYILSDSERIIIPKECYEDDSEEDIDEEDLPPTFPEFSKQVQHILDEVFCGKGVFVKTNFHSPKVGKFYFLLYTIFIPFLKNEKYTRSHYPRTNFNFTKKIIKC